MPKRNMDDVMRLTEPEQALQLSADTDLSFDLLVKNLDLDLLENTLKAIDSAAAAEEPTFYPRNAPARTRTATVAAAAAVLAAGQQEQPAPSPNTPLLEMGLSEDQVLTCSVCCTGALSSFGQQLLRLGHGIEARSAQTDTE